MCLIQNKGKQIGDILSDSTTSVRKKDYYDWEIKIPNASNVGRMNGFFLRIAITHMNAIVAKHVQLMKSLYKIAILALVYARASNHTAPD